VQSAVSELAAGNRMWFLLISILSIAGMVVSAVSLQRHYAKSATEFCDFSQKFNCDIVNRSEYSEVQGIPVAAVGVLGYATLFFLSTFSKSRAETPNRLLAASLAGLCFALYLTYIEAHALKTWCILCVGSQALIFLITASAAIVKLRSARA
jgi:vitamin-K-epoxide reductase (warfarin-sensitive)